MHSKPAVSVGKSIAIRDDEWRSEGSEWIGARGRRLIYHESSCMPGGKQPRSGFEFIDGTVTAWVPANEDRPLEDNVVWWFAHDDGDAEVLDEEELHEALLAHANDLFQDTYHDLIKQYVGAGMRFFDPANSRRWVEREELPAIAETEMEMEMETRAAQPRAAPEPPCDAERRAALEKYFEQRLLYVGNFYGHTDHGGTIMDLASAHARHKTTSCRCPMVAVLPAVEEPAAIEGTEKEASLGGAAAAAPSQRRRAYIKATGFRGLISCALSWPLAHPHWESIQATGTAQGHFICPRSVVLAAIRWPLSYEFIEPTEEDEKSEDYDRVVRQNQGIAVHIGGEAVMPALAAAICRCAAESTPPSVRLHTLIDLFCCGGGFSLGAVDALGATSLRNVVGVDKCAMVLRNFQHNVARALAVAAGGGDGGVNGDASEGGDGSAGGDRGGARPLASSPTTRVSTHEQLCPTSLTELRGLPSLAHIALGAGTHVHMSPPCQAFVNGKAREMSLNLAQYFRLMVDCAALGCTCSLEENKRAVSVALKWLAAQRASGVETPLPLYVYELSARDYGSPTGRERCVVTTFPLFCWSNTVGPEVPSAKVPQLDRAAAFKGP